MSRALGLGLALATLIVTTALLVALYATQRTCSKRALPVGGGLAAGAGGGVTTVANVLPLTWNPQFAIFTIQMVVGKSPVTAAFDTGSAQLIVATTACTSCTGTSYDPVASPDQIRIADPRTNTWCTSTVGYVSQTDEVQMYSDTVQFPRRQVDTPTLCAGAQTAMDKGRDVGNLAVTDFPVGGIISNTGTSSVNVFGMSAVKSVTRRGDGYLLPSCQTSATPAYESPILQALATFYGPAGVVWTVMFGDTTGFMAPAPLTLPCLNVKTIPLVATLTTANSDLAKTPMRFYVVEVDSIVIGPAAGPLRPLPNPPKQVLLDTGTTQFLLPGPSADDNVGQLNGLAVNPDQVAEVRLKGGAVLRYNKSYATYPSSAGSSPTFAVMPDATAESFSASRDVGILGAAAMRRCMFQFDLRNLTVAIAQTNTA